MTAIRPIEPGPAAGEALRALHLRWLGTVGYDEAWALQRALFTGRFDHLLLCEHPPVYTLGRNGDEANLLVDPSEVGAELRRVDRGGDITFHGPGQLVGYPIVTLSGKRGGGMADTVAYVTSIEQLLIDVAGDLGLTAGRLAGFPGVWVEPDGDHPRKLAAVGVRLSRARAMHGFALNVTTDLGWFDHIVPCGIVGKGVTSLAAEGVDVTMAQVVDLVATRATDCLTPGRGLDRQDVVRPRPITDLAPFSRGAGPGSPATTSTTSTTSTASSSSATPEAGPRGGSDGSARGHQGGVPVRLRGRLAQAGVTDERPIGERKPPWMRVKVRTDPELHRLKRLSRRLELSTVCEEAGCPNIYECWNEGTATYMLLGDRCTRACGFCLIDTRHPLPVDEDEPNRVATAVTELGLDYVVLTMVARDDLGDGGAEIVARTVEAIHGARNGTGVEVLISDLGGSDDALARICESGPEVINHNVETVPRLQRAVRPSASYARSLALLARARARGFTTKSGLIVGLGEESDEVRSTLVDLAAIGVDIVTVGQYLRPTANHLPVARWWTPDELDELRAFGEGELGIARVEASPLTRSSHHAASAAAAAGVRLGSDARPGRTRSGHR
jgi:lipoic acid synthetase